MKPKDSPIGGPTKEPAHSQGKPAIKRSDKQETAGIAEDKAAETRRLPANCIMPLMMEKHCPDWASSQCEKSSKVMHTRTVSQGVLQVSYH